MVLNEIIWENKETFGCEYLKIFSKENTIHVESSVIYLESGSPIQIDYQLELDSSWRTIKVKIQNRGGEGLLLTSLREGEWFDQQETRMDELDGAIDLDISATPFSNSLPINRYDWKVDQKREFEMVYVSVPSLEVQKVKQTYTYIEGNKKMRIFNYQCQGFESLISVDANGFVIDYPQLFVRRY
ncbi:putative glycolipid-binding domain-containing protein [Planomicrobium sp. Y74]|uniref:putative glycolipid-binding domain-containing protein n=1 Tax=Planomicrobium sp. Y74 TaxID=2478977 RepID=UPI000EF43CDD|nr:putative glycolipid-binding domain-containing protein [Planomicrobium sp. Y74]RLQ92804.1 hypothetical protein D9754_01955 [Planomicrobium sp. Y74]